MANSFLLYINDFQTATGLDYKTNIDTYIQYYQARLLDDMKEQQATKFDEIISAIEALDS